METGAEREQLETERPLNPSGLMAARADFTERGRRPLDMDALVLIRWLALLGQLVAVLFVHLWLGFAFPFFEALSVIGLGAAMNFVQMLMPISAHQGSDHEYLPVPILGLSFDILQLTALLCLTGGLSNPFMVLMIAPIIVSAAVLDVRSTVVLMVLGIVCGVFLMNFHLPLPWQDQAGFMAPPLYETGLFAALLVAILFIGLYVLWLAEDARRAEQALTYTERELAAHRQSTALGILATAAAHKLGSPLNTIQLISDDIKRDIGASGPLAEDVQLLSEQVARCRRILSELDRDVSQADGGRVLALPLMQVLNMMLARKKARLSDHITLTLEGRSADNTPEPDVYQLPELKYALENIVGNAADFASSFIHLDIVWSENSLMITASDDGPGLPQSIRSRIGQPGNSTRLSKEGHKGLGLFVVDQLIRQIGGRVAFKNGKNGGALIEMVIPNIGFFVVNKETGNHEG